MTSRRRTAQAVTNLDQMVDYLTEFYNRLPQALRTDEDVDLLFRCFGRSEAARHKWDTYRRPATPADLIFELVTAMCYQLATIRDAIHHPPFNTSRDIVERAARLAASAHRTMMRLGLLVGVIPFETQAGLLGDSLDRARKGKDRALFDQCLKQFEALYAEHRPQWNIKPWIQIERAYFTATIEGREEDVFPIDLVFLLSIWGGEEAVDHQESLRALRFFDSAPSQTEREVLRDHAARDDVRRAQESALYSSREDALQAAPQGLSKVGATVRTAQKHAAISELPERDAQRVRRLVSKVEIESLDEHDVQRPGASPDPLIQLENAEMAVAITSAIDQLPPAQRRVALNMRRSHSEGRPLRHYYRTDRQYKTAHGRWPAARARLQKLLKLS